MFLALGLSSTAIASAADSLDTNSELKNLPDVEPLGPAIAANPVPVVNSVTANDTDSTLHGVGTSKRGTRSGEKTRRVQQYRRRSLGKRAPTTHAAHREMPAAPTSPQVKAPAHLVAISAAKDDNYYFPENAGAGVTIFIIDTGLNAEHPEVKKYEEFSKHKVEFRDAGENAPAWKDPTGHGSCVWQHAVSPTYGAAKKAKTVMVRFRALTTGDNRPQAEKDKTPNDQELSQCEALEAIEKDILEMTKKDPKAKAIINISHGCKLH